MQRTCGDRGSQECSVNRGDQRGHKMSGRWNVGPATWHAESYETGAMEVVGGAGGAHLVLEIGPESAMCKPSALTPVLSC